MLKVGESVGLQSDREAPPKRGEPEPLSLDEFALWQMQAREDAEGGADVRNIETFGTDGRHGWSFEENVLANERIALIASQVEAVVQATEEDMLGETVASSCASVGSA